MTTPLDKSGTWPYKDLPENARIEGHIFKRAVWTQPYPGVIAQYREVKAKHAMHLKVKEDRGWVVDHRDNHNPDMGNVIEHFIEDHPMSTVMALGILGVGALWLANRK